MFRVWRKYGRSGIRCLILSSSSEIGGAERSIMLLAKELRRLGVDPLIAAPGAGPFVEEATRLGLKTIILPYFQFQKSSLIASLRNLLSWSQALLRERINLVHVQLPLDSRMVKPICSLLRLPVICHVRFPAGEEQWTWCLQFGPMNKYIFISHQSFSEQSSACGPEVMRRSEVIHNGVDLQEFCATPPSFPIRNVGMLANFQKIKGHEDFIGMAGILKAQGILLTYHIYGSDIHNLGRDAKLKSLVLNLGLSEHFRFHGFTRSPHEAMRGLDAVVIPSHIEPFGRTVIEAMAMKRVVIATQVGGIPEICQAGEEGWLVPAHSPEALAFALTDAVQRPGEALRRIDNARNAVEKRFSSQSNAEHILHVYKSLLFKQDPPA